MFSKVKIIAASTVLIFAATVATVLADTIKLKDGSVIKGKIIEFKNQQITVVRTGNNNRTATLVFDAEDIESVEFDSFANLASLINVSRANQNSAASAAPLPRADSAPTNNSSGGAINPDNSAAQTTQTTQPATTTAAQNNRSTGAQNSGGGLSQVINSQPISSQPISSQPNQSRTTSNGRFVPPLTVKVLADSTANGWTNTGLVVKKGQRLRISARGRFEVGNGQSATPAGIGAIPDTERLMKTEPTGALIAVIGDDNNEFVFVGANREFVAQRDGILFLGVNEGNLDDNSGAFDAVVEAEAS